MTKFTIEVYSDAACPWCYMGKKYLDRAIEEYKALHPDAVFELVWRPFYLNPKVGVSAYDKRTYLTARMTRQYGAARAALVIDRLNSQGEALGIRFMWEGRTGNTRDAHRLLLLARDREPSGRAQQALATVLFRGAFEQGRDVSDRAFLAESAAAAGVAGADEAAAWLAGEGEAEAEAEEFGRRADEEARRAREIGISAVPSYVVQGRFRVGGCQESAVFTALFDKIRRGEDGEAESLRHTSSPEAMARG